MTQEKLLINGEYPAILWGDPSEKIYIFVHGKMSCKESAGCFAEIAGKKGFQTLSFDLPEHGEYKDSALHCDVWGGTAELTSVYEYVSASWKHISLFACSLGAYFALNAFKELTFENCLFQSPIVDMEYLVRQMFIWFGVDEERLQKEGVIDNPISPLTWKEFEYTLRHPASKWLSPTFILYAAHDNMQSRGVIESFASRFSCLLEVSENSEHPFMQPADEAIVSSWMERHI